MGSANEGLKSFLELQEPDVFSKRPSCLLCVSECSSIYVTYGLVSTV